MYSRPLVLTAGMPSSGKPGDGWLASPFVFSSSADANTGIPVPSITGGIWSHTVTATRTDTTPTAGQILAAVPTLSINESIIFLASAPGAGGLTIAAGTNVTLAGVTAVTAGSMRFYQVTKTSDTTVTITGL